MSYNFTDFIASGTTRTSYRFSASARAQYRARWRWREIRVLDISLEGVRIDGAVRLHVGQTLQLRLPVIGKVEATVRWIDGTTAGCAFSASLDPVLLDAFVLKATTQQNDAAS